MSELARNSAQTGPSATVATLLSTLLLVPNAAQAQSRAPDFRRAWTCDARADESGINTTVIRTLDKRGRQIGIDVQWFVGGFDSNRLSISSVLSADSTGNPPLHEDELVAGWIGFPEWEDRRPWTAVLHRTGQRPNPARGRKAFEYSGGHLGMVVPWARVRALRGTRNVSLSLVDWEGRIVRSAQVDLRRIDEALARTRSHVDVTRRKAADFDNQCDMVTEWMTF